MLDTIKDPNLLTWLDANPAARAAAQRQEDMASKFARLDEVLKQAATYRLPDAGSARREGLGAD